MSEISDERAQELLALGEKYRYPYREEQTQINALIRECLHHRQMDRELRAICGATVICTETVDFLLSSPECVKRFNDRRLLFLWCQTVNDEIQRGALPVVRGDLVLIVWTDHGVSSASWCAP